MTAKDRDYAVCFLGKGEKTMALNWSFVALVNLILCAIVFILGYSSYNKKHNIIALYITLAFGFSQTQILSIAAHSSLV